MFTSAPLITLFFFVLSSYSVNAHGVLTAISGANGITSQGFGVIASTPRDGSSPVPFEQDTSVIRNNEIATGKTGVCGSTRAGGNNDVATQLNEAVSAGLPSASADGTVTMTLHQVNADGAGPYTCEVSKDATGQDFEDMTVTTNVPGFASLSLAQAADFPLVAQLPAGASCTGGPSGNACLVRCRNKAIAGPFGGCAAITTSNTSSTTSGIVASASADTESATSSSAAATASSTAVNVITDKAATKGGLAGKLASILGKRIASDRVELEDAKKRDARVRRSRVFAGRRHV